MTTAIAVVTRSFTARGLFPNLVIVLAPKPFTFRVGAVTELALFGKKSTSRPALRAVTAGASVTVRALTDPEAAAYQKTEVSDVPIFRNPGAPAVGNSAFVTVVL